jgi:hypothetical protein
LYADIKHKVQTGSCQRKQARLANGTRGAGEKCTVLVGKPKGERPPGGPLQDNIKTNLKGKGCESIVSIQLAQNSVAGSFEEGNEHYGFVKHGKFLD